MKDYSRPVLPGPGNTDYARYMRVDELLALQAPIVLFWDNLNTHVSHRMHTLIAARTWLTVIRLPAYAPDLNPTEGVWRWMKRGLTNTTARGVDHLAQLVKRRLRACQQQTDLLAGFLASTGMTLDPEPPK